MKKYLLILALLAGVSQAQFFPVAARSVRSGAELPATCRVGEIFFLTDTPIGLQQCTSPNMWEQLASGGSGIESLVEDTTPQLGGDLDLNGHVITNLVGTDHIDEITEIAAALKDGTGACAAGLICLGGHTHDVATEVSGLGTGVGTFLVTPSGANLATALTTALPASKGGTGLTALAANVVSLLGAADYAAIKGLLDVDDLITLSGVSAGAVNLGTFTGTTISDNQTIKAALQALETFAETISGTFDPNDYGTATWGSGSSFVWKFDASAGTDCTLTPGDGVIQSLCPIEFTGAATPQLYTEVATPSDDLSAGQLYFYWDSADGLPKYLRDGDSEREFFTTANLPTAAEIDDGGATATFSLFSGAGGAASFRAIADADVPNTITIDLASVATAVADADKGEVVISSGVWTVDSGVIDNDNISGSAAIALSKLATQSDLTILANISGGAAVPVASTVTAIFDAVFGCMDGELLKRGATIWDCAADDGGGMGLTSLESQTGSTQTITRGAGIGGTSGTDDHSFTTASGEADFLASGALTCGAATQGKMQVHTTPLQYCDNAGTPVLQYAAYGDNAGAATLAPTEAYDATNWNGDTAPPQKDAVRDIIETLPEAGSCTNQFVSALNASAVPTCATVTRADVEDELRSGSFSCALDTPTTTQNGYCQALFTHAITITKISCSTSGASSTATINIEERAVATPHTAGTEALTADLVCDTDSQASTTFTNATMAAQVPIALHIASVANAPTSLQVHVEYTID